MMALRSARRKACWRTGRATERVVMAVVHWNLRVVMKTRSAVATTGWADIRDDQEGVKNREGVRKKGIKKIQKKKLKQNSKRSEIEGWKRGGGRREERKTPRW